MTPSVFIERFGPAIVALLVAIAFAWKGGEFFAYAKKSAWDVPQIYSSVFNLSSLIAAFVFGFFTFARTSETEFLHKIRRTKTYARFMGYLVTAMATSAFVVLVSIPFMVAAPQPTEWSDWWFWGCLAWASVVAFSLAATVRSMRQFIVLAMVGTE